MRSSVVLDSFNFHFMGKKILNIIFGTWCFDRALNAVFFDSIINLLELEAQIPLLIQAIILFFNKNH